MFNANSGARDGNARVDYDVAALHQTVHLCRRTYEDVEILAIIDALGERGTRSVMTLSLWPELRSNCGTISFSTVQIALGVNILSSAAALLAV